MLNLQPPSSIQYRPEIDGLRALAVIAIVLFHLDIAPFSGGFVGVDIFFVISGYLIGKSILEKVSKNSFSLIDFFERRCRRLASPLLFVLACCMAIAYFLMMPNDLEILLKGAISTLVFSSNVYFYSTINYFDVSAETKPLLHMWSLSVEEQFYILFPLLLLFLVRIKKLKPGLLLVFTASLVLASIYVHRNADAVFYLVHFRAWEFILGLYVYVFEPYARRAPQKILSIISGLGLVLMLYPVFAFTNATAFPGLSAMLPCLGAALFIWTNTSECNWSGMLFSKTPIRFIGLISYSLYLWHWPLIAFYLYYLDRPLTGVEKVLVFTLTFTLSTLTYLFIEQPVRRRRQRYFRLENAFAASCVVCVLMAISVFGLRSHGFENRLTKTSLAYSSARDDWGQDQFECVDTPPADIRAGDVCQYTADDNAPHILLWGDSHSTALLPVLKNDAEKYGFTLAFVGTNGCPPILGVENERGACKETNEAALDYMKSRRWDVIILAANWQSYGRSNPVSVPLDELSPLLASTFHTVGEHSDTVAAVGQVPLYSVDIPNYLAKKHFLKQIDKTVSYTRARPEPSFTPQYFESALRKAPAVHIISPQKYLCGDGPCLIEMDGQSLYKDKGHLSHTGSQLVLHNAFDALFSQGI